MSATQTFRVEIPDIEYWQRQIKCQWGCPVRTDSRGYVIAIAEGRYFDAYKIARAPNPFASICGRVCGAPCEVECRRGSIDESITIRALKRFVTEQHGVEAGDPAKTIEFSNARRDDSNPKAGTKIAVIGGGVAGLTAAHDLSLLGYNVTVFEAGPVAGGMLMTGVPTYRLPRELVQMEIQAILSLGVELKTNTRVGKEVTIPQLRSQGFEAILIAAGLQRGRNLPIKGVELEGVVHGIDFLKQVNMGEEVKLGERVVVIGGGNVAFDVARSAVRVGGKFRTEAQDFYEAADSSRMALRSGAKEVHLVCLESRDEMPADEIEIHEGVEEGVSLHPSRGPLEIIGVNGKATGLATRKVKSVFDENGRFSPTFYDEPGEIIPADTIMLSIGQTIDDAFVKDVPDLALERGIIKIDPTTKRTNVPDIFACGDVAEGAKLFINAVASGQRAAISIDEYLRKKEVEEKRFGYFELPVLQHRMHEGYLQLDRINPPALDPTTRATTQELVELNFEEGVAQEQGARCLKCHINTIFNGDVCILCNGCVDVCPTYCLALVPLTQIELVPQLEDALVQRYGVNVRNMLEKEGHAAVKQLGSAMLKDEELCIRCGYCAKRCPTGAVTMEHFAYQQAFTVV
ncbi:MAG: FAD-dependent oxidoreductase [Bacteroidetes bacterium]|nr:FAD-dependent oxidoreductase [Bacteroidota bacterium]MCW5894672.1 FAD-dependent oxidoreductase [Bacteroidota bacterium]